MIYILTIHFGTPKWINIQNKFIKKFINCEHEIHTVLIDIQGDYSKYFKKIHNTPFTDHAKNLNYLAEKIISQSKDASDILVFLDGDAFPIDSIGSILKQLQYTYPLIAVQRIENNGDIQPHPCFAITTIKFWKEINGDWSSGYQWKDKQGDCVTDPGGNLLEKLEAKNIQWGKLHRSNALNIHPLFFGVYADTIYHHGAGFRPSIGGRIQVFQSGLKELRQRFDYTFLKTILPKSVFDRITRSKLHPVGRKIFKLKVKNEILAEQIYQDILEDSNVVYKFIGK